MAARITVGPAEDGQRLLRYLERLLGGSRAELYRWLRTGQVRVNGGRAQAERVLQVGDEIRLPPQASVDFSTDFSARGLVGDFAPGSLGADLPILYQDAEILLLNKPVGLPVQGGSGHSDSVSARLRAASPQGCYPPAPAHRLDLQASGLLLCGKTHAAQSRLHGLFRDSKPELERDYLCWVWGDAAAEFAEPRLLEDFLAVQRASDGRERMAVVPSGGKAAKASYAYLASLEQGRLGPVSLLRARLLTGRKHQIRVQLAARGFPLLGDRRYGGPPGLGLMLHAWHLSLPGAAEKLDFVCLPDWRGPLALPKAVRALLLDGVPPRGVLAGAAPEE